MESENSGRVPSFEEKTIKSIKDLYQLQKQHLNRQLAFEAMMEAMLARVQPEALPGLREEYEQACDRLAAGLRPAMQEPALWMQWSDAITERMQSLAPIPPVAPGKPYED